MKTLPSEIVPTTTALRRALGRPLLEAREVVANSAAILLGDSCSSDPTFRASEFVLAAKFAGFGKPILTNTYPNASIGEVIGGTPYNLDELILDPSLMPLFVEVFSDPVIRIEQKKKRMQEEGKSSSQINEWIKKYISSLPAGMFRFSNGTTYLETVINARRELFEYFASALGTDPNLICIENNLDSVGNITIRQLIELSFECGDRIGNIVCPQCSLSGDDLAEHVIAIDGRIYKNFGAFMQRVNGKLPACGIQKLGELGNLLDLTISQLIGLGIKLSGPLMYTLEALSFQNPGVALGIRDYTRPGNTPKQIAKQWEGLITVTPRVYIKVPSGRDATGFELKAWLERNDSKEFWNFVENLPLNGTNRAYTFILNDTEP